MTVLVGYVPTAEGRAAFDAGLAEAVRRVEPLVVLNSPRGGAAVSGELAPDEVVDELVERARAAGVQVELRRPAHDGDVVDTVLELAEVLDASVVVIGLRRRSAVGKLLMGSTAQRILLQTERPVLAVKPRG